MNPLSLLLVAFIRIYQRLISPVLSALLGPFGFGCRFQPTCSQYALEALRTHGLLKGSWLTIRRLGRCHPWGPHGDDPVPPAHHAGSHTQHRHHHRTLPVTPGFVPEKL